MWWATSWKDGTFFKNYLMDWPDLHCPDWAELSSSGLILQPREAIKMFSAFGASLCWKENNGSRASDPLWQSYFNISPTNKTCGPVCKSWNLLNLFTFDFFYYSNWSGQFPPCETLSHLSVILVLAYSRTAATSFSCKLAGLTGIINDTLVTKKKK